MRADRHPRSLVLGDLIREHAERAPDAPAILAPGRRPLSYRELCGRIEQASAALNTMGIGRGDRVALALPNGPEMAVAFAAVTGCATCAPLNPEAPAAELEFALADLRACAVIVPAGDDSAAARAAEAQGIAAIELMPDPDGGAGAFLLRGPGERPAGQPGSARPDDVALVLHTSGTTARPKIVPLTQRNLRSAAEAMRAHLELSPADRLLHIVPLFHIHGLSILFTSLAAGASVICPPGFQGPRFFEWMDEGEPTWYSAVPTMHQAILDRAPRHADVIARRRLRFIRSSSASLAPQVLQALESTFGAPVIEAYAMTEACSPVSINPLPPRPRKPGSVGVPVGSQVAVLDADGIPAPAGVPGEVAIRGENVMGGYENNPEANARAFTGGWFRTGDLGYFDDDGFLFISGRLKEIINRGGEKVSPREVDETLLRHPAVARAVTFAVPHPRLGEEVAAAVVLKEGSAASEREIQEFAASQLAPAKVPRRILFLPELPKNAAGKLQRIGLAERLGVRFEDVPDAGEAEFVPPRTDTERALAAIWQEVLGIERVGRQDSFVGLGGDSVLAGRILVRIRQGLGAQLSFLDFFGAPTLADVAGAVERAAGTAPGELPAIAARPDGGPAPLSFAQERLWFLDRLAPGNPVYNIHRALRLRGRLDRDALRAALQEVVARHEALRTTFPAADGTPSQEIRPAAAAELPVQDLRALPSADREAEAQRLAVEEAGRPFNLAGGPLLRARLLCLGEEEHVLLLSVHHIVSDGWSMGVLFRELAALYGAFAAGRPSPLPALPIQYADYAWWQRRTAGDEALRAGMEYWRQQLAGAPELDLLPDGPRPAERSFRGGTERLAIPQALAAQIKTLCRQEGVTLFMGLLAAFQVLLARHTGQADLVVGSPISGRDRVETEGLIGFFVNMLPLRAELSGDPPFREFLARVRAGALAAYSHQDVPFEKLVEELRPGRGANGLPLFQAAFVLQNAAGRGWEFAGLAAEHIPVDNGTAKFDLTLEVVEGAEGFACSLEYSSDLMGAERARRMLAQYRLLLESIAANPDERVGALPLLPAEEQRTLLVEWNATETDFPRDKSIHALFSEQAARAPEAVALVGAGRPWSYRELDAEANRLAWALRARGAVPGAIVGVYLERSPELVAALLAILKAGGAYLPLDLEYPPDRIAWMLADAGARVLITKEQLARKLPAHSLPTICLDRDAAWIAGQASAPLENETPADSLACVIYTSGSTGTPKGVAVTHRSVSRLVLNTDYFQAAPDDVIAQIANVSFDAATFEVWGALLNGARLAVLSRETSLSPGALADAIREHGVTAMFMTTSLFNQMAEESPAMFRPLRCLMFGGEAADPSAAAKVLRAGPPQRLLNVYGPTETTTFATWYHVRKVPEGARTLPIGRPIANTQLYILDGARRPVPIGAPGELYIGGPGVARGYLNRPELTAERFVAAECGGMGVWECGSSEVAEWRSGEARPAGQSPICNLQSAIVTPTPPYPHTSTLYKTGDLARYLPDGNVEFLGRIDRQVKIRGFRIEPGEIEAALCTHPQVRQAAVLVHEAKAGDKRLVAYVVAGRPGDSRPVLQAELRRFLSERLPEYMVPGAFVLVDALPLTPNGKLDRAALPAPEEDAPDERCFVGPRDSLERWLAQTWEALLGRRPVGISDDFFALGGHSLLAARLFARIERRFGRNLPLALLFQAPTVESLAALLRRDGWEPSWDTLVAIQPAGARPPLFLIHCAGGDVLRYRNLVPHLSRDQPLYGLQAEGLDGKPVRKTSVEEMARRYVAHVRRLQPEGPYYLGGYSFGGVVAFEMAQQLRQQGQEVALLVLFDTYSPLSFGERRKRRPAMPALDWSEGPERILLRKSRAQELYEDAKDLAKKAACRAYLGAGRPLPRRLRAAYLQDLFQAAQDAYVPQPYAGPVVVFQAERCHHNRKLGWLGVIDGGPEICLTPGTHQTILDEPNVRVLAARLQERLDQAQAR